MEQAFKDFIKENWPGFVHPEAYCDFENACQITNLKEAFKAGYEAGVRKVLEDYE